MWLSISLMVLPKSPRKAEENTSPRQANPNLLNGIKNFNKKILKNVTKDASKQENIASLSLVSMLSFVNEFFRIVEEHFSK